MSKKVEGELASAIARAYGAGMSSYAVAVQYAVSATTVLRVARELNVVIRRAPGGLPNGFKHSSDTLNKMRLSALARGISPETRKLMIERSRAALTLRGPIKHTAEAKLKMSMSARGRVVSEEVRAKISRKLMGRAGGHHIVGLAARIAMSKSHKGVPLSERHRKSLSEAARRRQSYESLMTAAAKYKLMCAIAKRRGVAHSKEHNSKISEGVARAYLAGKIPVNKSYACEYKGVLFRSGWEKKFAMWCDENKLYWEYEPITFKRPNGKTYIPDFELPDFGLFVEVKGRYDVGDAVNKMNDFVRAGHDLRIVDLKNIHSIHLNNRWIVEA